MSNKRKNSYSFRNDKKSIFVMLGDNKKFLMPVVFVLAVVLTVVIALSANKRAKENVSVKIESGNDTKVEIPELEMEENAYPEVNEIISQYYTASANGDSAVIEAIYKGLDDTELIKAVKAAGYIDEFRNITVYTKPGPVEGSYVAYVYNEVKLYDYEKAIPGLDSFYICTDDTGKLYINGDIADADDIEYLRQVNLQADVIDLNNRVATSYNDMVSTDAALADLLTTMRAELQVSVGEALATSEASTAESTEEAEAETQQEAENESEEAGENAAAEVSTVTTHTIRATDVINIRSSDSETADIISKTTKGQEFKQLEALANGWSKIEYNGGTAFVKTEFFEVVGEETTTVSVETEDANENDESATETSQKEEATESTTTSKVKSTDTGKMEVSDTVRLRKSESTDSEILAIIYQGDTINVIEQYANGWAKVEYKKKTGYIKSEFLTKE
ncbi:SH3 domain-containing protein [Butyrivibrio sp. YAB3001]|uniref:SH3 domain-containing protein n=1 Tax=Butyrivibrio sp. YAB3001 TaxID=1520812 RepID=UPI0008F63B8D|nr:SH3 domain-containing protein [Butyrivibrio sp. YAB3001]SFB83653.1 SH3 domain-containing protein [Butyrivibrio sp. YAB3001]